MQVTTITKSFQEESPIRIPLHRLTKFCGVWSSNPCQLKVETIVMAQPLPMIILSCCFVVITESDVLVNAWLCGMLSGSVAPTPNATKWVFVFKKINNSSAQYLAVNRSLEFGSIERVSNWLRFFEWNYRWIFGGETSHSGPLGRGMIVVF